MNKSYRLTSDPRRVCWGHPFKDSKRFPVSHLWMIKSRPNWAYKLFLLLVNSLACKAKSLQETLALQVMALAELNLQNIGLSAISEVQFAYTLTLVWKGKRHFMYIDLVSCQCDMNLWTRQPRAAKSHLEGFSCGWNWRNPGLSSCHTEAENDQSRWSLRDNGDTLLHCQPFKMFDTRGESIIRTTGNGRVSLRGDRISWACTTWEQWHELVKMSNKDFHSNSGTKIKSN